MEGENLHFNLQRFRREYLSEVQNKVVSTKATMEQKKIWVPKNRADPVLGGNLVKEATTKGVGSCDLSIVPKEDECIDLSNAMVGEV